MKENNKNQVQGVQLPPAWCSSICRNAMNEVCLEKCALKRDCSGFDAKPNMNLIDMPRFPFSEVPKMTKEEKLTVVTVYLAKAVDQLQGVEDDYYIVGRPRTHRQTSGGVLADLQKQNLLFDSTQTDSTPSVGTECENSGVGSSEVAGTSD